MPARSTVVVGMRRRRMLDVRAARCPARVPRSAGLVHDLASCNLATMAPSSREIPGEFSGSPAQTGVATANEDSFISQLLACTCFICFFVSVILDLQYGGERGRRGAALACSRPWGSIWFLTIKYDVSVSADDVFRERRCPSLPSLVTV